MSDSFRAAEPASSSSSSSSCSGRQHPQPAGAAAEEYALVAPVGSPALGELESSAAEVLSLTVRWGRTVIHSASLALDATWTLGAADDTDFAFPAERLGAARWTLLDRGQVVAPPGAIERRDGNRTEIQLGEGDTAIVLTFSRTAAGKLPPSRRRTLGVIAATVGGSMLMHLGVITAMALSPGDGLDADDASVDRATAAYLTSLSKNQAERERAEEEANSDAKSAASNGGAPGAAHRGPSGMMGRTDAPKNGGAYAIAGPPETREQVLGRTRALIESNQYVALGALATVFGNQGPIDAASQFASSMGDRPLSYDGNLAGDRPGDAFGWNGLGITGVDRGGGGFNDGLGVGRVGNFGTDEGPGGTEFGGGGGGCRDASPRCGRKPKTITLLETTGESETGGLPRGIVQRIVRANFPRLRACYEAGLRRDPGLHGTVSTRFVIDTTGAVESASRAGGNMSDGGVASCVVGVFATMSFPEPDGGKALVVYPVSFENE